MTSEFDDPKSIHSNDRVSFDPGSRPIRMRIGHSITVLVAICCLGGIALALFVGIGYRELDIASMRFEQGSQFLHLLETTESEIDAWLFSCESALDSGHSELLIPAAEHAGYLSNILASFRQSSLYEFTGRQSALMMDMNDQVNDVLGLLRARLDPGYTDLSPPDSSLQFHDLGGAVRSKMNQLVSSIQMERDITNAKLEFRRNRFDRAVFLVAAVYIMIVLIVWTRTTLTSIFPLKQLTTAATRALNEGDSFHPPRNAPSEIQLLSDALSSFIDKLEERVRERTQELERQKTDLEKHIAERHRLERRARNMALFVQVNPAPIMRVNAAGNILMTNPAAEALFERDSIDLLGQHIIELLPGLAGVRISQLVENGQSIERRLKIGERHFQFICAGVPELRAVHIYSHDITEGVRAETANRELEAQLRQTQRLETIGTLAGGIAHDFNNILTPILGYAEIAQIQSDQEARRQDLEQVIRAAHRAKDLVNQILAFSRQGEQERKPVELHLIIKEALKLIRASIPRSIEIIDRVGKDCGAVYADPSQLHQVIMNLCTNAYHAMREQGVGRLEVSLAAKKISESELGQYSGLKAGKHLEIVVSDTGCGMDAATRERIFEPFFTTKEVGEGTGLGLSVVHGIISKHGGCIQLESEPGKGTAFSILLPAATIEQQASTPAKQEIPMGSEHILFIDDEPEIVSMGEDMLGMLGYTVTGRVSGIEGLKAFEADPLKFDLVITDHNMPALLGLELAEDLRAVRPDLPIILITGFSESITPATCETAGVSAMLLKPLVMAELARAVRQAIDEAVAAREAIS